MKGSIIPKWYGILKDGVLILDKWQEYEQYKRTFEGDIELVLRRRSKPRSDKQNNYYFGVIVKIFSEDLGMYPEDVHKMLTTKFLKYTFESKHGSIVETVRSTAGLTTTEAEDYYQKCRMYGATDFDPPIYIPLPNEVEWNGKDGFTLTN